MSRYGLVAVEVDDYDQVPSLLKEVERRIANYRVWVSGSWPFEAHREVAKLNLLGEAIGRWVGETGRDLVTGAGVLVGPATMAGFMETLRDQGGWDLDRRLIARPFSQAITDPLQHREKWSSLRAELARHAGIVVFLAGSKLEGGKQVTADGVLEEYELAKSAGAILIPIGIADGAAKEISKRLLGSDIPADGPKAQRPTDEEIRQLADSSRSTSELVSTLDAVVQRISKANHSAGS